MSHVELDALDTEDFEGHLFNEEGEVIEGEFSIEWKGDQPKRVRQILETRRPTQKGVLLMVDREGRTRLPKQPGVEDFEAYKSLATGLCDATDGACIANELVRMAQGLPEESGALPASLYGRALALHPEQEAALAALDSLQGAERMNALRAALEAHPQAAPLVARVRALFPADVVPATGVRALEWLDLFATMQKLGVHLITDPNAGTEGMVPAERKLGTYRHSQIWGRADLIGFRSEHIFLVTPLRDARAIRDCLRRGELVVTNLEQLFGGIERRRIEDEAFEEHDMMILFLFESRDEYMRLGENLRDRGNARHAYTAGFFSAGDRMSRFYLPEKGYKYRDLMDVLGHELTHHWIFTSCPAFTNEEAIASIIRGRMESPGHWIVEGFASMMEELGYDEDAGTMVSMNARADRLDAIANSNKTDLLDWTKVFAMTHLGFVDLNLEPQDPEVLVPFSWMPDRGRVMTERRFYYAQAAATSHYLFTAENGAFRQKLLKFVVAYYRGDESVCNIAPALGWTDEELGERVWKHAQAWKVEADALRER